MNIKLTQTKLILLVSFFYTCFYNYTFFKKTLLVYPLSNTNILFIVSLIIILTAAINIFLSILRIKKILKLFLIVVFLLSSMAAFVMDSYNVIIDEHMFANVFNTTTDEAFDLITPTFFGYLLFLGILPSYLLFKVKITYDVFKKEALSRFSSIAVSLIIILGLVFVFSKNYASFLRAHKPLRYYSNPTYYIFSLGKYASLFVDEQKSSFKQIGEDARLPADDKHRELIILVVGETARVDRFSLNGYNKKTNPYLEKEEVISFRNMTSCGTSTAISVPCLFSNFGRNDFTNKKAISSGNLLDVLNNTKKVNILWRDNNSNSKGVADRFTYQDYKSSPPNTICDPECRDVGMLVGLQDFIDSKKEGDIFIVLHQMGNHGPAYYKRYPEEFEKFKPVCKTSQLENCTNEEIGNAYDNAILYTDYFLHKVILLLKKNSKDFKTTMFYVSDHGESLGENGVYLHGLPYFMAPDEQKKVAAIMWFGGELATEIDYPKLRKKIDLPYSHDYVFHTILGLMEVNTNLFKKELNIMEGVIVE